MPRFRRVIFGGVMSYNLLTTTCYKIVKIMFKINVKCRAVLQDLCDDKIIDFITYELNSLLISSESEFWEK